MLRRVMKKCIKLSKNLSGVLRTGIWDPTTLSTNASVPENVLSNSATPYIMVDALVSYFLNQRSSFLFGAELEEEGKIMIKKSRGVHLKSECVLDELQTREKRKRVLLSVPVE